MHTHSFIILIISLSLAFLSITEGDEAHDYKGVNDYKAAKNDYKTDNDHKAAKNDHKAAKNVYKAVHKISVNSSFLSDTTSWLILLFDSPKYA